MRIWASNIKELPHRMNPIKFLGVQLQRKSLFAVGEDAPMNLKRGNHF